MEVKVPSDFGKLRIKQIDKIVNRWGLFFLFLNIFRVSAIRYHNFVSELHNRSNLQLNRAAFVLWFKIQWFFSAAHLEIGW